MQRRTVLTSEVFCEAPLAPFFPLAAFELRLRTFFSKSRLLLVLY